MKLALLAVALVGAVYAQPTFEVASAGISRGGPDADRVVRVEAANDRMARDWTVERAMKAPLLAVALGAAAYSHPAFEVASAGISRRGPDADGVVRVETANDRMARDWTVERAMKLWDAVAQ